MNFATFIINSPNHFQGHMVHCPMNFEFELSTKISHTLGDGGLLINLKHIYHPTYPYYYKAILFPEAVKEWAFSDLHPTPVQNHMLGHILGLVSILPQMHL